jgi:hypothetical protein
MAKQDLSKETEISVWGPTQSGKDWMFRAFARELDYYNDQERFRKEFLFELHEKQRGETRTVLVDSDDEDIIPEDIGPTAYAEDFVYEFHRKSQKEDDAHRISAHVHRINIHNNSGSDLLSVLNNPRRFEETFIPLINSQYILIMLDPVFNEPSSESRYNGKSDDLDDLGGGFGDDDYLEGIPARVESQTRQDDVDVSDVALQPGISKHQYLQVLKKLFKLLAEQKNNPKRSLAICLTKMDTRKLAGSNHWRLLESIFGYKILKLIRNYETTFNIEVFATSAAGYYYNAKGKRVPNIKNGRLINTNEWEPVNCAAPFFWMFQNREIERIGKSPLLSKGYNLKKYIKYPPRRNI